MNDGIDIVIPWVDGSDEKWLDEKKKTVPDGIGDQRVNRYRDWDNLQYWFRGVEKYLPWVRKIHFITWGHLPHWLNTDNPKLNIVRHTDFIPEEYLPTFSVNPIELNFHLIPDLSEKFIYSNDDTYFIQPLSPSDFFINDLPVDSAIQNVLQFKRYDGISHMVANDLACLNNNFNKKEVISENVGKWFSLKYKKGMFMNLYTLPFSNFTGFEDPHLPNAFLKSTWVDVWEKCGDRLKMSCNNKVRSLDDVNQWLMRYWQFATGNFIPAKTGRGKLFVIGQDDSIIERVITERTMPMICLSDDKVDVDFEKEKEFIISCFEKVFPQKSSFEK